MKRIFFLILSVLIFSSGVAQNAKTRAEKKRDKKARLNTLVKQEEEGVIYYKKQRNFGFKLNNDGYGAFIEFGKAKNDRWWNLLQIEFNERKHPKEEKEQVAFINTTPLVYGKTNFFYNLGVGMQKQYLLGNKTARNGVNVSANFGGGLSLGLLRPYEVLVDKNNELVFVRYNSPDSLLFKDAALGGPRLGNGWSGLKIVPGLYTKAGLRFDYGLYSEVISAIEVGFKFEFYTQKIEQLFWTKQRNTFINTYFALSFGHRK
jgi:hypothetical protein